MDEQSDQTAPGAHSPDVQGAAPKPRRLAPMFRALAELLDKTQLEKLRAIEDLSRTIVVLRLLSGMKVKEETEAVPLSNFEPDFLSVVQQAAPPGARVAVEIRDPAGEPWHFCLVLPEQEEDEPEAVEEVPASMPPTVSAPLYDALETSTSLLLSVLEEMRRENRELRQEVLKLTAARAAAPADGEDDREFMREMRRAMQTQMLANLRGENTRRDNDVREMVKNFKELLSAATDLRAVARDAMGEEAAADGDSLATFERMANSDLGQRLIDKLLDGKAETAGPSGEGDVQAIYG